MAHYQRTATAITSRGNRKPANTEDLTDDVTRPVCRPLPPANATVPPALASAAADAPDAVQAHFRFFADLGGQSWRYGQLP